MRDKLVRLYVLLYTIHSVSCIVYDISYTVLAIEFLYGIL